MKKKSGKSRDDVIAGQGSCKAERELMIAEMTDEICRVLKERELTQREAAKLLGATQAEISRLMRGQPVNGVRLLDFLMILRKGTEKVKEFDLAL